MYEVVWRKMHDENELAKSKCRMPCFVQQDGVYVFKEVLEVVASCFSSVMMYGMCSISLLRLVLTGM